MIDINVVIEQNDRVELVKIEVDKNKIKQYMDYLRQKK